MKLLNSKIFDGINIILPFIQNRLDKFRTASLILSDIDIFILISITAVYLVSSFAPTEIIGAVSFIVPLLVFFKVLITKGEKIELERCNFYLLLYLIICFITNFTSSMPLQSLYGFMKTLIYFAFYFALCQFLKNNKKYIFILLFVIAAVISVESIIGIIQNAARVENISTWQDTSYVNPEDVLARVYGTLKPYNPNLFGGYLIAGLSSIIAVIAFLFNQTFNLTSDTSPWHACLRFKSDFQKKSPVSDMGKSGLLFGLFKIMKIPVLICSFLCFFISVLCIFLTGCRGAYIALFIIIIAMVLASFQIVFFDIKNEKLKKIWKSIVAVCALFGGAFMLINHGILHRLMSIFILRGDSSTSFRMNVYNSAIQMFHDNPVYGIGVGNKVFREIYGLYMLSGFDALSCYCVFLEMAVESGIFALLAYLFFLGSLLISAVKKFVSCKDLLYKILLFVSFISITAVMFHGVFDTVYFRPQIQYLFWTMAAILTVLVREEKTAE